MRSNLLLFLALIAAQHCQCQSHDHARLQVRLATHLTSYASRPGSPFKCVVISPFKIDGQILIPARSVVYGRVRRALPIHLGLVRERAELDLDFLEYVTPDGKRFPLAAQLVSIDNAREEVVANSRIKGVLAAANPDEVLNGIWEKPTLNMLYRPLEGLTGVGQEILEQFPIGPIGPAVLLGIRCFLLRFPEPEIHLPPGTDMDLSVDQSSTAFAPSSALPAPPSRAELNEWIRSRPFTIQTPRGRKAEDVVNVAFIGSRRELLDAFYASGWYPAEATTIRSFCLLYLAFNGKRTYLTAPVSTLLYQGRVPDLVFEKSLDTVSKRHHVRIWSAGAFQSYEIWLGAATHDTGVGFNHRTFRFTHTIDKDLDAERAKISIDLTFAGCSEPVVYLPRGATTALVHSRLPSTDGDIAVLPLRSCSGTGGADADPGPGLPGNKVSRLVRRVALEARSYIFRENAYYWAYQIIRSGKRASSDDGDEMAPRH